MILKTYDCVEIFNLFPVVKCMMTNGKENIAKLY